MTSSILERNHVQVIGDGPRTMIFAHGFGSDQTVWRHQVEAFAPDYRVVLFDHMGAGKSDLSAYSSRRYSTLHGYVEDLLDICGRLQLERCVLVGHSVSGMVGLLAAVSEPQRFSRLVLIGASPRYLNDEGYLGGFERGDLDGLYAAMSSNYHAWASGFAPAAVGNPERPELAMEFAASLTAMRPDIAQTIARAIFESDHRADLPQLELPALIVQSNNDIAVPHQVGEYMEARIGGSARVLVDAQGHFPHMAAPAEVTRAIQGYLARPD